MTPINAKFVAKTLQKSYILPFNQQGGGIAVKGKIRGDEAKGFWLDLSWQGKRYSIRNRGKAFRTHRTAFRALEAINEEIDHDEFDVTYWSPAQRKKHLLKNLTPLWLKSKKFRPATMRIKKVAETHVLEHWGNQDIRKLRRNAFMSIFREYPQNHMTRNIMSQTQAFLRWAYREEYIDRPVFIDRPNPIKREKKWLTVEQQEHALEHLQDHYHPIIRFIATYGCRINEASALMWDCIDFEKGWISLKRVISDNILVDGVKEGGEKGLPMTDSVHSELLRLKLRAKPGQAYVFVNKWGNHYGIELTRAYSKATKQAGFPGVTVHSLRHSFVQNRIERHSLKAIGTVTGQNEATTELYTHQSRDLMLRVIEG